eukprot:CAMPEP_0114545996 /NCGR_PEP_ID=MMETSP0114-20121206/3706_1 /TAXON_ID=31324 /ORGANISM="Goniomonas sp, Strain m" /LENGTH=83 /DNA_ID=CAMNT_0001730477 /DNA_START=291 /DNA_END=542 /DNA_ORIENTATION=-
MQAFPADAIWSNLFSSGLKLAVRFSTKQIKWRDPIALKRLSLIGGARPIICMSGGSKPSNVAVYMVNERARNSTAWNVRALHT